MRVFLYLFGLSKTVSNTFTNSDPVSLCFCLFQYFFRFFTVTKHFTQRSIAMKNVFPHKILIPQVTLRTNIKTLSKTN